MIVAPTQTKEKSQIAVIGRAGHASRIIGLLEKHKDILEIGVFHPKVTKCEIGKTVYFSDLNELWNYEKIIISSPNHTHEHYLKLLFDFDGEILCEKPGDSLRKRSQILERYLVKPHCNLRINYNYLRSDFYSHILSFMKEKKYGKKIGLFIRKANSLALDKNKYEGKWRADKSLSTGIDEVQTVHYINLLINLFGDIKLRDRVEMKLSEYENAPTDTVYYSFSKDKFLMNIFNSYATVYEIMFELYTTKAKLTYDGKYVKILYPSDSLGSDGRFTYPRVYKKIKLDFEVDWKNSLENSIKSFVFNSTSSEENRLNLENSIKTLNFF